MSFSILDILKQRLAERPNNRKLANMVGQQRPAARSGIPGVNDVISPGGPGYPNPGPTPPIPQPVTHQTAPPAQTAPPPPGVPPQYAQSVYDKENSSFNRLQGLRNANAGYGNNRFYAQGEIYTYDPASQGYRGSISGSVIQQPQGPRPPDYTGYANNGMMFPSTPAPTPAPVRVIPPRQASIEQDPWIRGAASDGPSGDAGNSAGGGGPTGGGGSGVDGR